MVTAKKETTKRKGLSAYEQETIISFNKGESTARIFTYEKTWQRRLEHKLHLKPVMDNGYGGKEYLIDKNRIPLPRLKRVLTAEHKQKLTRALEKARFGRQRGTN